MVFGHDGVDTEESLKTAVKVTKSLIDKYGAVPRPYAAKPFIPGNKGWLEDKYQNSVEAMIQNPKLFQALDFAALPSILTHQNSIMRNFAAEYGRRWVHCRSYCS